MINKIKSIVVSISFFYILIFLAGCTTPNKQIGAQLQDSQDYSKFYYKNQNETSNKTSNEIKSEIKNDVGPTVIEKPPTDSRQQAKQGEVTRTVNTITLALKAIKYEVKGEDYAIINEIDFGIVNEGSESISPQIAVYLWDENDPIEYKAEEKVLIDAVGIFGLGKDEYVVKNATVRIPFDDINLTKHIKLSAIEDFAFNPRTFVSVEYDLTIKNK